MMELLSNNIFFSAEVQLTLFVGILSFFSFFVGYVFHRIINVAFSLFNQSELGERVQQLLQPYKRLTGFAFGLAFLEIMARFNSVLEDYQR